MPPLEHITDHVDQAQALLISQYQEKPRLAAWLKSYTKQVQDLADAIWDVCEKRLLDNATGPELKVLGRIVGEPDTGHDDDTYRHLIAVRIRINRSKGRASDVIAVLRLLTSVPYLFDDVPMANMLIELEEPPAVPADEIYTRLHQTKGGGIGLHFVVATTAPETQFLWGDDTDTDPSTNGWGDEDDDTVGGELAAVFTTVES